jgi:hypothetical protein
MAGAVQFDQNSRGYVWANSTSAYHGPDPRKARDQLELLKSLYKRWGPTEFARRAFWIIRKNPEEGERDIMPNDSRFWNRRLVPFVHNRIQRDLDQKIIVNGSLRNIILKPRQVGLTTWIIIMRLLMPALLEPGTGSMLISQNAEYAAAHFGILKLAYRHFMEGDPYDNTQNDWAMGLRQHLLHTSYSNRRELIFDQIESRVRCASAEVEEVGQGLTLQHLACCLHPDTWMFDFYGRMFRFKNTKIGDIVPGSDGAPVRVEWAGYVDAKTHPYKGAAFHISLGQNASFPVVASPNHEFLTQRGLQRVDRLTTADFFAYPKRSFSGAVEKLPVAQVVAVREQGGGSQPMHTPTRIHLNMELGFACGLYLAEGNVAKEHHYRSRVTYCLHGIDERYLAFRAFVRLQRFVSRFSVAKGGRVHHLYGRNIANWMAENFGIAEEKRVPDWIWDAPREFAVGMLEGWLAGDGSIERGPKNANKVVGVGKLARVVFGMREVSFALGIGGVGISYVEPKPVWREWMDGEWRWDGGERFNLIFTGECYYRLASLFEHKMGIKQMPVYMGGKKRPSPNYWREDARYLYFKIRKIRKTKCERFFDIQVSATDHLYTLPVGVTHNTELSRWEGKPEETLANAKEGIAMDGTLDIECTPNGAGGYFFEEWNRSTNFHEWWWHDEYRREPAVSTSDYTEEERALVLSHGLVGEQIAWRREKQESLRHNFPEKYPEDDVSAFILSGNAFFEKEILNLRHKELQGYIPLQTFNKVTVYAKAVKHRRYIIGVDVATGLPVTSSNPDFSAAVVIDQETGEEMASYRAHVLPEELANDMDELGHMYNMAEIAIERNNEGGTVIMALKIANQYGNIYIHKDWWKRDWQNTRFIEGFMTTMKSRPIALNRIRWMVSNHPELIHDVQFVREALSFVHNEKTGKPEAMKGAHDDTVLCRAISQYVRAVRLGNLTPDQIRSEKYGATPQEYAAEEEKSN